MGTRINVVMDNDITAYRDQSAVLARLEPTFSAALAVQNYWNTANAAFKPESEHRWTADPIMPHEQHYRSYTGPGSLFLKVGPHAAKVRTGGRWRDFLSIPPLRDVHLQAFRSIAKALGATQVAYFPDCEDAWEVLYEGGRYSDVLPILEGYFGLPQPSSEMVSTEIVADTDSIVTDVWYSEDITARKADL